MKHCKLEQDRNSTKWKTAFGSQNVYRLKSVWENYSAVNTSHLLWRRKKKNPWLRVEPRPQYANVLLGSRNTLKLGSLLCNDAIHCFPITAQKCYEKLIHYLHFFRTLWNLVYFTLNTILIWTSHTSVFNSSISSAQHAASSCLIRQCRSIPLISKFSGNCSLICSLKMWSTMGQVL